MGWRATGTLAAWLCLVFVPAEVAAQINPKLSEAERGIRSGDNDDDAAKHLRIEELLVTAHVTGPTADVTLELLLASEGDDDYEANLALALPPDAVVTGYSLSVDGALIPGQLLEQPKARNLYEDEVREGIDPGLAEVSTGNRFTTRIYPIDSEHPRRFRLSFAVPFDPARGIVLPLARDAAIGRTRFDVTIDGYGTAPAVRFAGQPLALAREGAQWHGGVGASKRVLREGVEISGGRLVAPLLVARHDGGERFFVIADAGSTTSTALAGRLRIYWDRSLSHGLDGVALETRVLARLIDETAPTAIDLVTFASDRPQVTTLKDVIALRKALGAVVYRGGTSFSGLDGLALPPAGRCVLVSDGQVTIDRGTEFVPDCPLTLLTASKQADGARLGRIAQGASGQLVRVADGGEAKAAAALVQPGTAVTTVRDASGRRIAFRALPAAPGSWLLTGPMPDRGGVRVRLGDGSERRYDGDGPLARADAPGALWAAQQVQILGDDPARHQTMVEFARRYHVAGPAMALLVLERPDQYLRAHLTPPVGFPQEWMDSYREAKKEADEEARDEKRERFDFVLEQWAERKAWWKKRFVVQRRSRPAAAELPTPAPEPASAPPPPPALTVTDGLQRGAGVAVDDVESDDANVVVTGFRARDLPVARVERPTTTATVKIDLADLIAKRPYIVALAAAGPLARLDVLAEQERAFGSVPGFYLDSAEWFRSMGDRMTADALLLSALELPQSDDETRQIVAFRLERDKAYDRAVELAEQLAAANAEFRPQPARDLALALAARARSRGKAGRADLERAFTLLTDAALNPASSEFDGFEVIALMEANALISDVEAVGGSWTLDPRLVALLDTDVRIVIEWTADDADIDLWVNEPNGERVNYSDKLSSAGGQVSNDMTDGYGPEEYAIHRAPGGTYAVRINGYDADRLNPNGTGHVLIRLIRNFGRRSEEEVLVDADLSFQQGSDRDDEEETRPVATLHVSK